jgi:phage portal protein BeeE
MIGDVSGSTSWGTGIEQQSIMFVRHTLMPWLVRMESVLQPLVREWAVVSPIITGNFDWYLRFNVNGLLRGDSIGRAALYDSLMRNGAVSPNWILSKEDENPYPGGDSHYLQTSYAPIGPDGALLVPAKSGDASVGA